MRRLPLEQFAACPRIPVGGTVRKTKGRVDDIRTFYGLVQPRMERMFGAITRSFQTPPPARLNAFQS